MRTSYKDIKKKVVETKSGTKLGKVCNLIIDTDSDTISKYEVSSGLLGKKLLISPTQIISYEQNKIIVKDNIDLGKEADNTPPAEKANPEPVAMSEIN